MSELKFTNIDYDFVGRDAFQAAQKKYLDETRKAIDGMAKEAADAIKALKPVEDMTSREKMGILIAAKCEIDYFNSDGVWKTVQPCGILLMNGEYRVYEDNKAKGTSLTFVSKYCLTTPPPETS